VPPVGARAFLEGGGLAGDGGGGVNGGGLAATGISGGGSAAGYYPESGDFTRAAEPGLFEEGLLLRRTEKDGNDFVIYLGNNRRDLLGNRKEAQGF